MFSHWPCERHGEVLPARHCGGSRCPPLVSPPLHPYWLFHLIWHRLLTNTKRGGAVSGHVGGAQRVRTNNYSFTASMLGEYTDSEGNVCAAQVKKVCVQPPTVSWDSHWSVKHLNRFL